MLKRIDFYKSILYNKYAVYSATRIRPVVANAYRKWLILIFLLFSFRISQIPIDFPDVVCYNNTDKAPTTDAE